MRFDPTPLKGSWLVSLDPVSDDRGWFARYFCKKEFQQIGHDKEWVQMNQSVNYKKGTLRGMHYQVKPYREIKMIRCISGAVYDVIVDIRKDSETFLQWFGVELSAENKKMLYIPEGFAHGFQTLADDTELLYHHTEYYQPGAEGGIRYSDLAIGIQWPLMATVISSRDEAHPLLTNEFKGV